MTTPPQPPPFVLPTEPRTPERHGTIDVYAPDAAEPRPAVVIVHGGPLPAEIRPTPRDWPVYQGYGAAIAARGAVAVTVDHRLHDVSAYPVAAEDVVAAVEFARADPRVAADRVAIWFFSGGGLLLADWLRKPPSWLRCVAATYPYLAPLAEWTVDERFRPIEAVGEAAALPIVLTRVGKERPEPAAAVEEFIATARASGARLEVIDVPNGQHSFDMLDHTDESRAAVERALTAVLTHLRPV
jgi:acetyl esterase/lipase